MGRRLIFHSPYELVEALPGSRQLTGHAAHFALGVVQFRRCWAAGHISFRIQQAAHHVSTYIASDVFSLISFRAHISRLRWSAKLHACSDPMFARDARRDVT
jgi:hypothetical protein